MLTLQHVTINTKDLEKSMEFYEEVFSFIRAERPDFSFAGAWYWIEPEVTMLHLQHKNLYTLEPYAGFSKVDHIALDASEPGETIADEHKRWSEFLASDEILSKWSLKVRFHTFNLQMAEQIFITDPINHVVWELNFPK
jgi:catechol 2,3-dioxygenase-like lactoylglutathione lyase family enzyme